MSLFAWIAKKFKDEFGMIKKVEKVELPDKLDEETAKFFEEYLRYELERAEVEQSRFANLPNLLAVTISIAVAANIAFLGQKGLQSWIIIIAGVAILLHVASLLGVLIAIFFMRHRSPWLEAADLMRPSNDVRRDIILIAYKCTVEYVRRRAIRWVSMLCSFLLFTFGLFLLAVAVLGMIINR
jgi:hypothetical protein